LTQNQFPPNYKAQINNPNFHQIEAIVSPLKIVERGDERTTFPQFHGILFLKEVMISEQDDFSTVENELWSHQ
jgi:hypothetical protein